MRVIALGVSFRDDLAHDLRVSLHPSADQEERGTDLALPEDLQNARRHGRVGAIVEREGNDSLPGGQALAIRSEDPASRVENSPGDEAVVDAVGRENGHGEPRVPQQEQEERQVDRDGDRQEHPSLRNRLDTTIRQILVVSRHGRKWLVAVPSTLASRIGTLSTRRPVRAAFTITSLSSS